MGNSGTNMLARMLDARMKAHGERSPFADFGSILGDMGLLLNCFPVTIPASDYVVCDSARHRLIPGVRVFVVWAGDDAVVIDTIGAIDTEAT